MQPVQINFIALLACGVVNLALGFLWYGPLFGKDWMRLMGFSDKKIEDMKTKGMGKNYAVAFIGALIMAFVLTHAIRYAQANTITEGIIVGFWNWLGFIAVTMLGMLLWEAKPLKLYIINTGYYLVSLIIMGAILAVWM